MAESGSSTNAGIDGVVVSISQLEQIVGEANALAKATNVCAAEGNLEGAMKIALDIEPLLFEANHILQAATSLWRRNKPAK